MMRKMNRRLCLLLSVLMVALMLPTAAFAAESDLLQTKVLAVKEKNGQVTATYETRAGEMPNHIYYAVSKNGQFVWDNVLEVSGEGGKQECALDIPAESLGRAVYDVVVWGAKTGEDGNEITSEVFAFKVLLGSSSREEKEIPRIEQPRTMIVKVPFSYVAGNSLMDDPVCYLKCGDIVNVYSDPENAIVYITKGDMGGYMYSRALASKVFDFGGKGNEEIVEVALSQVGNVNGEPYWSWYGFNERVAWCACFVSWCADQIGLVEQGIIPKFAACTTQGMPWFIERGQWEDRNCEPEPGYVIFFDWDYSNDADHVGIVEKCEDGVVYTIEGNSSNECRQRSYPVGSNVIRGYGVPAYE